MPEQLTIPLATTKPIDRIVRPFVRFARIEAASGIVLLACTIAALLWANSPFRDFYNSLLHFEISFGLGRYTLAETLHFWINDGLMAVFFLLAGLEIKREVLTGELASVRKAALPILAALGGVLFPALIYTLINHGTLTASGWGIPMATDIAFALGILALLGKRVPLGLKIFLTALAIADDIAAVLVIAVFYSDTIHYTMLFIALGCLVVALIANLAGVSRLRFYLLIGIILWLAMLRSGIHATLAGVLLALVIPSSSRVKPKDFIERAVDRLTELRTGLQEDPNSISHADLHNTLERIQEVATLAESPLDRLEHHLQPWVSFSIMPLFALTNAGVTLSGIHLLDLLHSLPLGIYFGLVFGKPLGIVLFSWIAVKLHLASLPDGVSWAHIHGAGWLAGIGFTMSLFIASLAFGYSEQDTIARIGILLASTTAAIVGSYLLLKESRRTI
ncbi:MAG: Na+/H+ antiporter NhaA [Acidobacteriaceae bacterium]